MKFLETHEWHKIENDIVTIGITNIAAEHLTDITFVALPKIGKQIKAGESFGEVESVKATSDLYSGVSGEVVEANHTLSHNSALVNSDPFGAGWMIKIKISNCEEFEKLLNKEEYEKTVGENLSELCE